MEIKKRKSMKIYLYKIFKHLSKFHILNLKLKVAVRMNNLEDIFTDNKEKSTQYVEEVHHSDHLHGHAGQQVPALFLLVPVPRLGVLLPLLAHPEEQLFMEAVHP